MAISAYRSSRGNCVREQNFPTSLLLIAAQINRFRKSFSCISCKNMFLKYMAWAINLSVPLSARYISELNCMFNIIHLILLNIWCAYINNYFLVQHQLNRNWIILYA